MGHLSPSGPYKCAQFISKSSVLRHTRGKDCTKTKSNSSIIYFYLTVVYIVKLSYVDAVMVFVFSIVCICKALHI